MPLSVSLTRVAQRRVVDTVSVVGYARGTPALCCLLPEVDLLTYKTTLTLVLLCPGNIFVFAHTFSSVDVLLTQQKLQTCYVTSNLLWDTVEPPHNGPPEKRPTSEQRPSSRNRLRLPLKYLKVIRDAYSTSSG